jgi:hypothetical protein
MTKDVHSELEMKNAFGLLMKTRHVGHKLKSFAGGLLD